MPSPRSIAVRFLRSFPVFVHGGITTWKIDVDLFDKGGKRSELFASCVQERRYLVLAKGHTRFFHQTLMHGVTAREGTPDGDLAFKLLRRAVRQGLAEPVAFESESLPP